MALAAAYRGGGRDQRPGWWLHLADTEDLSLAQAIQDQIPAYDRLQDRGEDRVWIADESLDVLLAIIPELQAYMAQGKLL